MPFTNYAGVFTPGDLKIVQQVYDRLCVERGLDPLDDRRRAELADEVIQMFRRGLLAEDGEPQSPAGARED